jgi:hypothetical protein
MTKKEQRAYIKTVERLRLKLERRYAKKVYEALQDIKSSFITAVKTAGPQAALKVEPELVNAKLLEVYAELFRETYQLFARFTLRDVTRRERTSKTVAMHLERKLRTGLGTASEWAMAVNTYLRQYGLQMVSTITGNSRELYLRIVNNAIQEGVAKGLSQADVADMIVKRLGDEGYTFDRYRAFRISRTETNRAANEGHMGGAASLPFTVTKVWISALDKRTRRISEGDDWDHWALDQQTIDLETPYKAVSSEGLEIEVQKPGEVTAPPGFTINCRCRVAFEGKRDANGNLIMKL